MATAGRRLKETDPSTMSEAHSRKKQPEFVRKALLEEAARIAATEGLAGVTIDAVSKAAGVTKGGLFHHFASKQALIDGLMAESLAWIDAEIDRRMAADPDPAGRFTRAYVDCLFDDFERDDTPLWAAVCASLLGDASLRQAWKDWTEKRLEQFPDEGADVSLTLVRLAADGAWYAALFGIDPERHLARGALRGALIASTRRAKPSDDDRRVDTTWR